MFARASLISFLLVFAGLPVVAREAEEVVTDFFAALHRNDLSGAATLVHPESLEKLRDRWHKRVLDSFSRPEVIARLQPYTRGDPKSVVESYDDRVIFERFIQYVLASNQGLRQVLQRSTLNVLESRTVAGTAIVTIEYVTGEGSQRIARRDSVRVRKDGLEWKVLLSRELDRALDLMLTPPAR